MNLEEGLSVFSGFWGIEYDQVRRRFVRVALGSLKLTVLSDNR